VSYAGAVTVRRSRTIGLGACGLIWLTAVVLLVTADWHWVPCGDPEANCLDADADAHVLGLRIGASALMLVAFLAFVVPAVLLTVERIVRWRTDRRRRRGEPWWMHT
jgi:hypothetical protein